MDALLKRRVALLTGREPVSGSRIQRGYTPAERWVLTFADGSSVFAKLGTTELTSRWLRAEHVFYTQVQTDFVPRLRGWSDDAERPLLLLEDLSAAHWPPPWDARQLERVLASHARLRHTRPLPAGLPELEIDRSRFAGWLPIERDPEPFLSLGMCSRHWLEQALPALLAGQARAVLAGEDLVHNDLRSDNLCLLPDRVVFVDWNNARRGNASLDLVGMAPSLRLEGGPLPEEIAPDQAELATLLCGYFAANAGLPMIVDAPRVRPVQLRQLRIALPWVARLLGLPPLDVPWGRNGTERLSTDLAAGRIDEAAWFAATEELLGDAYLAASDPRAQSGKSGDEVEWRWSRELALEALPAGSGPFHVLDVGCANGYLLESFVRWSRERNVDIEPHGLDISPRLASLARWRWPALAERVAVGNVLSWSPQRRYDLVHTALDYVPPARRRECIARVRREFLAPGGRIVLRGERLRAGEPDLAEQLTALGFQIGGVLDRRHPTSKELRRTAWLGA